MDLKYFNPWTDTLVGTNRLTHWDQPGATYFLTFRLADSLPHALIAQWHGERDLWLKWNPEPWSAAQEAEYHERFSSRLERWLDDCHGECLLRHPEVRDAVENIFIKYDDGRYRHHAWVLMPNHAHLLFSLQENVRLETLLKAWKGASARAARLVSPRVSGDGGFWQKDYFDRLVRDKTHFWNCVRYIRRNPVKARLREGDYTLYLSDEVRSILEAPPV